MEPERSIFCPMCQEDQAGKPLHERYTVHMRRRRKQAKDRPDEEPDSTKADLMQESGHAREGADGH